MTKNYKLWLKINEIGLAVTRAYEFAEKEGRTDILNNLKEIGEKSEKLMSVVMPPKKEAQNG